MAEQGGGGGNIFQLWGEIALRGAESARTQLSGIDRAAQTVGSTFTTTGQRATRAMDPVTRELRNMAREFGPMDASMTNTFARMADQMRAAHGQHQQHRADLLQNRQQWVQLGLQAGAYAGATGAYFAQITALAQQQKAITDAIAASNQLAMVGFIQSIGQLLVMKTQSDRVIDSYNRMRNPIYQANNGLLAGTRQLELLARQGNAAVTALRMLGPTATMKQLRDQITLINQGIVRFQAVALAAAIASAVLYGALHKAAMGNAEYKQSFETMLAKLREAFQPMVDVFTMVMIKVYDFISAVAGMIIQFNKAHPTMAKFIQAFLMLIPLVTLILSPLAIGIGLINGMAVAFATIWPIIAPLVIGLGAMSATVWIVIAAILALIAAGIALYKNWNTVKAWLISTWTKIKEFSNQVWTAIKTQVMREFNAVKTFILTVWNAVKTGLTTAWNFIKNLFVQAGSAIKTKAVADWNSLKNIVLKAFNATKNGLNTAWTAIKNAFRAAWAFIKGIAQAWLNYFMNFTPLGYVIRTLIANWNSIKELFRISLAMVKALWQIAWTAIKNFLLPIIATIKRTIQTAWNFIKQTSMAIFNAIAAYFQQVLNRWKLIFTTILNALKTAIRAAWNAIKLVTTTIFNAIKVYITNIFNFYKNLIMTAVNFIASKVKAAWTAIKNTTISVFNSIKSFLTPYWNTIKNFITGAATAILNNLKARWNSVKSTTISVFNSVKSILTSAWNGIKNIVSNALSSVANTARSKMNQAKNNITSPISSAVNTISGYLNRIRNLFSGLRLQIPKPKIPKINVATAYKKMAGVNVPYPKFSLSWMAKGGIVDGASVVGVGEDGPEAIVPLLGRRMAPFAKAIAANMPAAAGANMRIEVPVYLNGREIARAIAPNMDRALEKVRQTKATFRSVTT